MGLGQREGGMEEKKREKYQSPPKILYSYETSKREGERERERSAHYESGV